MKRYLICLALAFNLSCSTDDDDDDTSSSSATTYTSSIKSIMDSNCATSGCHDAATNAGSYDYSDYAATKDGIAAGLVAIKNGTMPKSPNDPLTAAQIASIEAWIAASTPE